MPTLDAVRQIIETHGYVLLFPLAIIEGPIVTVIAAFLAAQGYLAIVAVYAIVILADLVGDTILYVAGRFANTAVLQRWGARIGASPERMARLRNHFEMHGGKTLVIGKLTHSAGFAVLLAAGASSMPFLRFIWYNLLATIPKSLVFALIGYLLGAYYNTIDSYIYRGSIVLLALAIIVGFFLLMRARRNSDASGFS
jgi:membrane protein DedA with SNARE-associated domain